MPSADALDSRRNDFRLGTFSRDSDDEGEQHFSDDGFWYQPIDPGVSTGIDDQLSGKADPSRPTNPTLKGDLPGTFDYLRVPGNAEEMHPRVFPDTRLVPRRPVRYEGTDRLNDDPMPVLGTRSNMPTTGQQYERSRYAGVGDAGGFGSDRLNSGEALLIGQAIFSPNKQYRVVMQGDGNLVLYKGQIPLWNSGTQKTGANRAVMQKDGNFVVYAGGAPKFNTGTQGRPTAIFVIQNDGNAVVKDPRTGAVFWNSGTWGGVVARDQSSKSLFAQVTGAIGSAASAVGGAVASALPIAQTIISFVPGVGAGVNAAIAAGTALAKGQPITQAVIAAARGALPGGPLAQQGLDAALAIAKGGKLSDVALNAARANLPGGPVAQRAFDTGLALARGQSLQKAAGVAGLDDDGDAAMTFSDAIDRLSPINNRVMSQTGPQFLGSAAKQVVSLVQPGVARVAQALLSNPGFRQLPIAEVARRMGVPVETAQNAMASLVQSIEKAGSPSLAHMTPAYDFARRLAPGLNFDQAIARYASHVGPMRFSPDAMTRRARPMVMSWFQGARGFTPMIHEASGLDASGTAYIVESGDSMSKIATKLTGQSSRVGELIKANPQVKDPNKINVGQRLNLPASWMTAPKVATQPPPITTTASPMAAPVSFPTLPAPASIPQTATLMPTISEKAGSSGPPVVAWQNILIRDKFAPAGTADGFFGPNTTSRTKQWQSAHGLSADGAVGPNTWAKAMATLPQVVASSPSAPVSVSTPLGPIAIPAIFQPTMATISENPLAAPISTTFPQLPPATPVSAPVPGPTLALPQGATIAPDGSLVVSRPSSGQEVTVHQEPITAEKPSGGVPTGLLVAGAVVLGGIAFFGSGTSKKLL